MPVPKPGQDDFRNANTNPQRERGSGAASEEREVFGTHRRRNRDPPAGTFRRLQRGPRLSAMREGDCKLIIGNF